MLQSINSSGKETESMSFRLNQDDLNQLRQISRERRESLNTLVSQILGHYLKLGILDEQFGFVSVSKDLLRLTFVELTNNQIEQIAKKIGAEVHKQIIRNKYGSISKKTVLEYLEIFCGRYEAYKHFIQGSRHTITVSHDMNLAFSKVYYNIVKSILELAKIEIIDSESDMSDRGFSISFDV